MLPAVTTKPLVPELYPYQKQGLQDLLTAALTHKIPYLYLAWDLRTGKSILSLSFANKILAENVLIICPATLRLNWLRESAIWYTVTRNFGTAILSNKDLTTITRKNIGSLGYMPSPLIVSYNMLATNSQLYHYVINRRWDLLIADEADALRNLRSKQTQRTLTIWRKQEERAQRFNTVFRVLLLSGTPLKNSALDLFPPLHMITPKLSEPFSDKHREITKDYHLFAHHFTHVQRTRWGTEYVGIKNHAKLRALLKPELPNEHYLEPKPHLKYFYRKTLSEVAPEMPPKTYIRAELDLNPPISSILPQVLQEELLSLYENSLSSFQKKVLNTPALMEARRLLGETKANSPQTYEYIRHVIENCPQKCAVIFAHHRATIQLLTEYLSKSYNVCILDGSTTPFNKEQAVRDFQEGKKDVFIGSVTAAGMGITLSRANEVVFVEFDWLPSVNEQAAERCTAVTKKEPVGVHYLLTQHRFEQKLITMMIEKQKNIRKVI